MPEGSGLQKELDRELAARHPLTTAKPIVVGRCLTCDDVAARLTHPGNDAELAVVHLTWSGRAEKVVANGTAWPFFERLTFEVFVDRFVRGGEHL